jgi:hypothetical protein
MLTVQRHLAIPASIVTVIVPGLVRVLMEHAGRVLSLVAVTIAFAVRQDHAPTDTFVLVIIKEIANA